MGTYFRRKTDATGVEWAQDATEQYLCKVGKISIRDHHTGRFDYTVLCEIVEGPEAGRFLEYRYVDSHLPVLLKVLGINEQIFKKLESVRERLEVLAVFEGETVSAVANGNGRGGHIQKLYRRKGA